MFERVYLGPEARREHAKVDAVVRTLFNHYCEHPEEIPGEAVERATLAERVTDYVAGMTDRYCIRAFTALSVPDAFDP
jgi:dGTPase